MRGARFRLSDDYVVLLNSYRLQRFLDASTHSHLCHGRVADEIARAHQQLLNGTPVDDPFIAHFFRRDDHRYYLRDEFYYCGPFSIFDPDLQLIVANRRTHEHFTLPVDRSVLASLAKLLPAMISGVAVTSDVPPQISEFFDELDRAGAIVPAESAPARSEIPARSVTLVGHSTLLVESPRARVLIDPILTVRLDTAINLTGILSKPLDAVVISHSHWDHFNLDTLMLLDRSVALVVPKRVHPASIVNVGLAALLADLGFENIVELAPWESFTIGDLEIVALPFHGESAGAESERDWMTYQVRTDGLKLIGTVDACADEHGTMDEVLARSVAASGPVDVLFSAWSGFYVPQNDFERRPFLLNDDDTQYTALPDDIVRWARICEARYVVPYADFVYGNTDDSNHTAERVAALRDMNAKLLPLHPGESFTWSLDRSDLLVTTCPT